MCALSGKGRMTCRALFTAAGEAMAVVFAMTAKVVSVVLRRVAHQSAAQCAAEGRACAKA